MMCSFFINIPKTFQTINGVSNMDSKTPTRNDLTARYSAFLTRQYFSRQFLPSKFSDNKYRTVEELSFEENASSKYPKNSHILKKKAKKCLTYRWETCRRNGSLFARGSFDSNIFLEYHSQNRKTLILLCRCEWSVLDVDHERFFCIPIWKNGDAPGAQEDFRTIASPRRTFNTLFHFFLFSLLFYFLHYFFSSCSFFFHFPILYRFPFRLLYFPLPIK